MQSLSQALQSEFHCSHETDTHSCTVELKVFSVFITSTFQFHSWLPHPPFNFLYLNSVKPPSPRAAFVSPNLSIKNLNIAMAVVQSVHFLNPYSTEHNLIGTFCWLVPLQKDSFSQVHYCCPTGNWLPLPGKTEDDISCSFCFLSPSVMSLGPVPQVGNQQNALYTSLSLPLSN